MESATLTWAPLLSAIVSGLVVFGVSAWYQHRREVRKEKLAVLGALMGNRHGLTVAGGDEAKTRFIEALNSAYVVFHKSTPVVEALNNFKTNKGQSGANVTCLLRKMLEDLKIDTGDLDDSFFDEPFTAG